MAGLQTAASACAVVSIAIALVGCGDGLPGSAAESAATPPAARIPPPRVEPASLELVRTYSVPGSSQRGRLLLNDLEYESERKWILASGDLAIFEFPLDRGVPEFGKTAFWAHTAPHQLQGFTHVPGIGSVSVENREKFVFLGWTRAPLPPEVWDVAGLTFDGTHLVVADAGTNTVHRLRIEDKSRLVAVNGFQHLGAGRLAAVTWDGSRLWSADEYNLYALDGDGRIEERFRLPGVRVSGIAFVGRSLLATALEEYEIYSLAFRRP